jgi:hypothetical protein
MLDLSPRWPSVSLTQPVLAASGLDIKMRDDISQHLVSGNLGNWSRLAGMSVDGVGAFGLTTGLAYPVRIASDRMLAVNAPADAVAAGWHPDGFAVTDMSAALCVIEMQGENLPQIIRRATPIDPRENSPSASCQFAQVTAAIYHHGDRDTVRLHIDRSLAPYVWKWLELNVSTAVDAEHKGRQVERQLKQAQEKRYMAEGPSRNDSTQK